MEFVEPITSKEDALLMISEWIREDKMENGTLTESDQEAIFNSAIWVLQELAEYKGVEYRGYYRTRFEKDSEFQRILWLTDFDEQRKKRELYVHMAAQDDSDVFKCLHYTYRMTRNKFLDEVELFEIVYQINVAGLTFQRS